MKTIIPLFLFSHRSQHSPRRHLRLRRRVFHQPASSRPSQPPSGRRYTLPSPLRRGARDDIKHKGNSRCRVSVAETSGGSSAGLDTPP
ncbi:unnamed protein product [Brassica rapa subsp. trilocularis]